MEGNAPRPSLLLEGKAGSIEFGSRFVLDTSKNFQGNEAVQHALGILKNKQDQRVKIAVCPATVEWGNAKVLVKDLSRLTSLHQNQHIKKTTNCRQGRKIFSVGVLCFVFTTHVSIGKCI